MNIFFQSGEFIVPDASGSWSWPDFFVECFGSLAGFTLGYCLYLLQTKDARKEAKLAKKHANNSTLFYTYRVVHGATRFATLLKQALDKSIKDVDVNPLAAIDVEFAPHDDLVRVVERINQQECVFAYHAQLKDFAIASVFEAFDYINLGRIAIQDFVKESRVEDHGRKIDLKNQLIHLRNEIGRSFGQVDADIQAVFNQVRRARFASDDELPNINEVIILPIREHSARIRKQSLNGGKITSLVDAIEETCKEIAKQNRIKQTELIRTRDQIQKALLHLVGNSGEFEKYVRNLQKSKEFQVQEFNKLQDTQDEPSKKM